MTIADVLQLPDGTEIDRVSGVAECWAQESAESTGGTYTFQNGRYSENGFTIRLRINNCLALPTAPTPVELIGPGVIKKTFRDEAQIYVTGRATIIPAQAAPPTTDPAPPPAPVVASFPTFDPAASARTTDFPASPAPPAPDPNDFSFPPAADSLGIEYVSTPPPPTTAPAPAPATIPAQVPNGSGELSDHFVAAVRIALDVCARTGIEFYPELVATVIIDAQRRGVSLK